MILSLPGLTGFSESMNSIPRHQNNHKPFLGFGLGLRHEHYQDILNQKPILDWFEIITENYLVDGGKPLFYLDKIRENYPIVMHGVSLSIGGTDAIDFGYLNQVKTLAERIEPAWVSDHLCWTGVNQINMHDLLPLPYTKETIEHVVSRIQQVQDTLRRRILIENVSSYVTYQQSDMAEWEFLTEITNRADCYILLDVNNVYVNAINHSFDPMDYIRHMPKERIYQIHLAGHSNQGNVLIDTHDSPVSEGVWALYAETLVSLGAVSTMIERDANIPSLNELLNEVAYARKIAAETLKQEIVCA